MTEWICFLLCNKITTTNKFVYVDVRVRVRAYARASVREDGIAGGTRNCAQPSVSTLS